MAYSITGFVYLFAALSLVFLSIRFYQNWQREKTVISKGFFWFASLFCLFFLVTAIGGLFFAQSPAVLKYIVVSVVFIQSSASAILGYIITYMKFPKTSPWLGFSIIFVSGIVATFIAALTTANPFLEPSGIINWNLGPATEILRPLIFLSTIFPMGIILIRQGMVIQNREAKIKAIGLGWAFLVGVVTGIIDFTLKSIFHLGAISTDISVLIFASSTFLLVIFTQNPPKQEWVKMVGQ
ncbi:MAG: hypothetical protein Q7R46_00835 [bacterium]|nr:hypothetical protein [bacterium]